VDGIRELLPDASGISSHRFDTKGSQFEATLDIVRKYLRRRKPGRVLVGAVNDTTAMAALQAFREVGLEKECAIAGQDGSILTREEMRRPSVDWSAQSPISGNVWCTDHSVGAGYS